VESLESNIKLVLGLGCLLIARGTGYRPYTINGNGRESCVASGLPQTADAARIYCSPSQIKESKIESGLSQIDASAKDATT
jgi:hypothetical protein